MKEFLNTAMSENRAGTSKRVKRFSTLFEKATALAVRALGQKAFHIRGPLNSSALDSVMCTLIDNLDKVPANLSERFKTLVADPAFTEATYYGTSDAQVVQTRFTKAREVLLGK
jgi:hypothetical protein